MENDASDLVGDVLFMSNLGVSEENIALLKRIPLQDVKDIIDANKNHLKKGKKPNIIQDIACLLYTSPSPRDRTTSRMPSSA